ncbi:PASTA domain-containing protein [Clostridium sp. AM58-1XD]|uniref:PASTA domain-containing protein n=1 Tax=Clostridium sp. AM58-1XD TaxID=2292307 RepID=UPI000E4B9C54|nr:PASTA domain-containing protein [Clostridium sp. AM58-1XD]RGZ01873.1 PASTA domain-containing protein [Clostridium sp. AM58-1XD]
MIADYIYLAKISEYSDTVPKGVIISQEEAPGTVLKQNGTIHIKVSEGREMVHVPDLQYKSEEEAMTLLGSSGLTADRREEYSDNVASGVVTRQETEAESMVEKGTSVVFYVSMGPRPVQINKPQPTTAKPNRTQAGGGGTSASAPQTQAQTAPQTAAQTTQAQTEAKKETADNQVKNDISLIDKWGED